MHSNREAIWDKVKTKQATYSSSWLKIHVIHLRCFPGVAWPYTDLLISNRMTCTKDGKSLRESLNDFHIFYFAFSLCEVKPAGV